MKTNQKSAFFTIFLVVLIDLIGFGIVIPILPYYAKSFGASAFQLGLLMMTYSLMQFLIAPIWGSVSDRVGRRPVLLLSILGTSLSLALLAKASTFGWLIVGRTLAGVFGANISTAYAYVTDITTPENRAKGMGLIGAGFGIGFIIGPAIGGVLSPYGYSVPILFASAMALGNVILGYFALPEPNTNRDLRAQNRIRRMSMIAWQSALGKRETRLPIVLFFILTWAATQMEISFGIFLFDRFHWDARRAGILLAAMGFTMALMQGGLIGRLAKRYGEWNLIPIGAVLSATALVLFGGAHVATTIYTALFILAVGNGMLQPSLSSLVSKGAEEHERGAILGVFQSAGSLARIIGPLIAGALYDHLSIGAPFFAGALLISIIAVAAFSIRGSATRPVEA